MNKMTTRATLMAVALIVSIPLGLMAQDDGYYAYSFARLSYVNGSVHVQRTGDLGYEKGEVNLALVQGDKLGTESGQAEIHFGRRNYLRLADYTKVEFSILPTEGNELIKLHLTEGSAFIRVSQLALEKGVEVHTPDASFYVLEEGLYRFDVALDRETRAYVREGSLEAATEDGSVMVRYGESVTAADGRLLGDPEYARSPEDAFDEWSGSRDAQLSARSERQYLPSGMEEYEEELDQNGRWIYERPYGNVWVPNVSYNDDWRPYYYGRWVWYPVIGWTWVSSESWGWSVYHYGRWHWRFGLGWYWIPRHHWGPAWVHWWHDRDYIGWCPLTWHNRPGYFVGNRFYDRYDDRTFSAHNRAMTVVRRDHLQARDIGRRHVGNAELSRIDRVSLRAEQPTIRPAIDRSGPEARAAQRALSVRPGSRSEVRSVAPSRSLSASRLRQATGGSAVRSGGRGNASSDEGRGAVARPAVRERESGERSIRTYPSQRVSGSRSDNGAADRRSSVASPARRNGAEGANGAARVSRSQDRIPAAPKPTVERDASKSRVTEKRSEGAVPRKAETIKNDRTAARSESSAGRSQSRTYTSRSSVSRPSSRLSAPSTSARPSSPSSSSARARSSYSSPSRTAGAPSRGSYAAPRSSGSSSGRSVSAPRSSSSSGRSYAAPRSSGSSGRSYSAPRSSGSSSGRSVSSPRSSGSSSGRSSSSSRSGSSSSRSSGSSSKSGSVKKKG